MEMTTESTKKMKEVDFHAAGESMVRVLRMGDCVDSAWQNLFYSKNPALSRSQKAIRLTMACNDYRNAVQWYRSAMERAASI